MRRVLRAGLAAAGLAAPPALGAPPEPVQVVESGVLTFEPGTGAAALRGGAVLRRGSLTLRAAEADWDQRTGEAVARGGVLLAEPGRILAADSLRLEPSGAFEARGVRAWLKEKALDLAGCRDVQEAERTGRNRVSFAGDRLAGASGQERLLLEGARITLCDCGGGPPSWEIRASRADVEPGRRALLDWPVLYVTPRFLGVERLVPVFALPWGYLPLAERQTGVLLPELRFDRNGFGTALPFYATLGRSWDLTVAPEFVTGPTAAQLAREQRGVRGPGAALELRWAPAEGATGLARVHLLHSTLSAWPAGAWKPEDGNRIAVSLRHSQRLGEGGALAVDAGAVGDPFYLSDFTGDVLLRNTAYRRSAAAATWRGADLLLSAEAGLLEPLAYLDSGALSPADPRCSPPAPAPGCALGRAPFGRFGTDLSTFHRLPAAAATVLPVALGPVRVGGQLQVARFGPLAGTSGDEGADGIGPGSRGWGAAALDAAGAPSPSPLPPDGGERDGRWQPGERLAATRAVARAEASTSLALGRVLAAEPWLSATALGYAFEAARAPAAAGRVTGGLALSSELSRRWGEGDSRLLHAVAPRAEWRAGLRGAGAALPSGFAYDEADLAPAPAVAIAASPAGQALPQRTLSAAPPAGFQQLRLAIRNRLVAPAGALSRAALDLDVGQDLDLSAGRRAETWASLGVNIGPVALDAGTRFYAFGARRPAGIPPPYAPSRLDDLAELRATLTAGDRRGDVHFGFLALGPGGSQRLAAGPEALFDPRPIGLEASATGSAGLRARWSAAVFSYDLQFTARRLAVPVVAGGKQEPHVFQQVARFAWDSPCRCFKLGVVAALREGRSAPDVGLVFDLGGEERRAR